MASPSSSSAAAATAEAPASRGSKTLAARPRSHSLTQATLPPSLQDSQVHVLKHPVVRHKITQLRRRDTSSKHFRELLKEITLYLGYEATSDFEVVDHVVETPAARHTGARLATRVAVVPIMRAGLGMVDPMLTILPMAVTHHIGMFNNKLSLLPVLYYNKLPARANVDVAIVLEPQIATSGTVGATIEILREWGGPELLIKVVSVVASRPGLETLLARWPNVQVFVAAVDDQLTEEGAIMPGAGDFGDRLFSTFEGDRASAGAPGHSDELNDGDGIAASASGSASASASAKAGKRKR